MVTRFSVMMVALVVGSGFGCKDKGKAEPEPGPKASADAAVRVVPPDAPLDAPVNPWAGAGSCKVKVTGAATIDQTDSAAAVQASWWLTDVDRAVFPQADSFMVNCSGQQVQVSINTKPGIATLGAKAYTLSDKEDQMGIQAAVAGTALETPKGKIDITRFDLERMTGSIVVTGKLPPTKRVVTIKADFDVPCPGYSGCKH
jgi:hypothetical protein